MSFANLTKPELLAPAGNFEKLQVALIYGADAVYVGGKNFNLRAFGDNFDEPEILRAVEFAHGLGRKIYVAVNVFAHNRDFAGLESWLKFLDGAKVDAVLVSDPGVFALAKETTNLNLHVSTQANVTNARAARAWSELGASRIVLARELSREEIAEIKAACPAELEIFVHGAMCISYSGRCYLSRYLTGRDGNGGECTHSCRWRYALTEEKRPGEFFEVAEDGRGAYVMNSKDLCLLPHLDKIISCGVASLKIEGRMKSANYVAGAVKVYRAAIDSYFADPENFFVKPEWTAELNNMAHRPYTTGFFVPDGEPTEIYETSKPVVASKFLGIVRAFDEKNFVATIEQRGKFSVGESVEFFRPRGETFSQKIDRMTDADGQEIFSAPHAQQVVKIKTQKPVEVWTLLRSCAEGG